MFSVFSSGWKKFKTTVGEKSCWTNTRDDYVVFIRTIRSTAWADLKTINLSFAGRVIFPILLRRQKRQILCGPLSFLWTKLPISIYIGRVKSHYTNCLINELDGKIILLEMSISSQVSHTEASHLIHYHRVLLAIFFVLPKNLGTVRCNNVEDVDVTLPTILEQNIYNRDKIPTSDTGQHLQVSKIFIIL